ASSQWPRAGASFATRRSCLESGHRSVRPHPGDAMPAIHQRPGLRSAAVAALCALACACAQVPSRDASVAGASPAVDPATGSVRVLPDPAPAPHPGAHAYTLDPVHTRIVIAVDHAGFSKAVATVSGTTGTLQLVPGSWEGAQVE